LAYMLVVGVRLWPRSAISAKHKRVGNQSNPFGLRPREEAFDTP